MGQLIRSIVIVAMFFPVAVGVLAGRVQAEQAGRKAVTVVILPPHLKVKDQKTRAAAELFCDRLAEKLSGQAGIKVVDRKHLKKVLAERNLSSRPTGPALAYDAMVRIRFAPSELTVSIVDLTLGNLLATKTHPFKGEPDDKLLDDIAELCASSARPLATARKPRLKVRIVGATYHERIARLEPLGWRLTMTFEQALGRSPGVRMVRHLEAGSAAEESLLILMGLSRLPGGRRFAPQSDAMIEFRLREMSAIGKTFEDTTVEAAFRIGGARAGKWTPIRGKVRDWDGVMQRAWEAAAKQISGLDLKAARDFLNEMPIRRRQAEAEIAKYDDWLKPHGVGPNLRYSTERLRQLANTAATAAKIDPTCEKAAYLNLLSEKRLRNRLRQTDNESLYRQARRYLERHNSDPANRTHITEIALRRGGMCMYLIRKAPREQRSDFLAEYRRFVESSLNEPVQQQRYWRHAFYVNCIHENMVQLGVPPDIRNKWSDKALAKAQKRLHDAPKAGFVSYKRGHLVSDEFRQGIMYKGQYNMRLINLRIFAMKHAIDDGRDVKARKILDEIMQRPVDGWLAYMSGPAILKQAKRFKDPALLTTVDHWLKEKCKRSASKGTIRPLQIAWPTADFSDEFKRAPTIKGRIYKKHGSPAILGIIGPNMYIVTGHHVQFGYNATAVMPEIGKRIVCSIRLDEYGGPVGDKVRIALPKTRISFLASDACALDGKLYVGTWKSGLLAYDPKACKWKIYGAAEGLPDWTIHRIIPLDDRTLLCIGGQTYKKTVVYTLDVKTGQITLRRRGGLSNLWKMSGVWRNGKEVVGVYSFGMIRRVFQADAVSHRWPTTTVTGWRFHKLAMVGITRVIEVKGRRFLSASGVIRQIDSAGKVIRDWSCGRRLKLAHPYWSRPFYRKVVEPGIFPGWIIGQDDAHLFIRRNMRKDKLVRCYDVEKDTWYGPVKIEDKYGYSPRMCDPKGLWLRNREAFLHYSTADIKTAAEDAGLVVTSAELMRRRLAKYDAAPPLDAAKFALGMKRFDKARTILTKLLKDDPDNPEMLLMMGLLHGWHGLKQYPVATDYYRRLAAMDDPSAKLAGLYYQYVMNDWRKNYGEALRLGERIIKEFKLSEHSRNSLIKRTKRLARLAKSGK